jgi:hypothetical protein
MKTIIISFFAAVLCVSQLPAQSMLNPSQLALQPAGQQGQHVAILLKCAASPAHYTFSQISAKVMPGLLPAGTKIPQYGDFVVVVLDDFKNPIDTAVIRKPFEQLPPSANDDGTAKYRTVTKTSHQSMVRFNYNPSMKFLMINKIGKNGESTTEAILPLVVDSASK